MNRRVKGQWLVEMRRLALAQKQMRNERHLASTGEERSALGALCNVVLAQIGAHWETELRRGKGGTAAGVQLVMAEGETEPEYLSETVAKAAGLEGEDRNDPELLVGRNRWSITQLNEGEDGAPLLNLFQIANLVEDQL